MKKKNEESFSFTWDNLRSYYQEILHQGYKVITCEDYVAYKTEPITYNKLVVNRVDVDVSIKKALILATIFNDLKIKGSFFIRLHANEYNPFSFENFRCLKVIKEMGHEIGYHSEIVEQSKIWNEDAEDCLQRDIDILNRMLGINIKGVASHGGMTGLNNLDFWKNRKPQDFDLLYEAYDQEPAFDLMNNSFYISDSCWTYWKCYDKGTLIENDRRNLSEHLVDNHPLIYLLVHPDTYYENHIYE